MDTDIILVGNGPSILGTKLGKFIDSHELVVRFNNFNTSQYFSDDVGTKTDYWFNTINYDNKNTRDYNLERIYLHSWKWKDDKLTHDYATFFIEKFGKDKIFYRTKESDIKEMMDFMGNNYFPYSTGAIAAWLLLKEHQVLNLVGFDWWKPSDKHHYNDSAVRGTLHKPEKEYEFFMKLGNRIKFIS